LNTEDPKISKFKGRRVFAIDGSVISVPNNPAGRKIFGAAGGAGGAASARASLLYDVLNGVIIDARLEAYSVGERTIAFKHHQKALEFGGGDCVILYDRGCVSSEMAADLCEKGLKFVFRLNTKQYSRFDLEKSADSWQTMSFDGKTYVVRLVKFPLKSGEMEVLVANFDQSEASVDDLRELYNMRRGVESEYGRLKIRLGLEIFTGTDKKSIQQDFYIACIRASLTAIACFDASAELYEEGLSEAGDDEAPDCSENAENLENTESEGSAEASEEAAAADRDGEAKPSKRKYAQKLNFNSVISGFVLYLPNALLRKGNFLEQTRELLGYVKKKIIPIRSGREF
jgi:hypothetical protein